MIPTITPPELKDGFNKGDTPFLLDVREPWGYTLARLDNSHLIPLGPLPESLPKLDRNRKIVAYCRHGMRSADAAGFLLQ
ncbi:MAG: rhodanese-like domain-containing protein [Nitrospira sp.]